MLENRQLITGRWCFKLKKDCNGQILKYKAWWISNRFKQEERVDFVEILAAVVKSISYKCPLGVSVKCSYKVQRMDVLSAFLYGFLDEIIYIEQSHFLELNSELVCHIHKALYGLKQAPKVWYKTLVDFL